MSVETVDNLHKSLQTILASFLDLVQCDGGSVYTVRKERDGESTLVFQAMITRSIHLRGIPNELGNLRFKIDENSIVGKTAVTRKPILLNRPEECGIALAPGVGEELCYTTRNIFSAPLITPRGDLVGVVQLLNKLPQGGSKFNPADFSPLPPFDAKDERLFSIFSAQAALAIENSLLLEEQERLMEGIVNACVTAIEARDPITSGHSVRVAHHSVELAVAVTRTETGPLRDVSFTAAQLRELRFASMLHDVGKIAVSEKILQKEKKLHPHELENIALRLRLMRTQLLFLQQSEHKDYSEAIRRVEGAWTRIVEANEPTVVHHSTLELVKDLRSISVPFDAGEILTALTEDETRKLTITKGSLLELERLEVESHVNKTFEILKMIPWSKGLEQVPDIAYKHHESLDGSGYPNHLKAADIPPQARTMTICDIFDALVTDDRPYKPALPTERALDIIASEVKAGQLDSNYFEIFTRLIRETEARLQPAAERHYLASRA
jgi:HD-GYP domain-containing protein (c-di-GMP phosphodiesterase class II)